MHTSPESIKGSVVFALCYLLLAGASAQAQINFAHSALPLSEQKVLENEPALAVAVSFESQRKPLGQLLADLSRQGGMTLSLADDSLSDRLVTARVKGLPLAQVLASLAHLYGATWQKKQGGFALLATPRTPLQKMMFQSAYKQLSYIEGRERHISEEDFEGLRRDIIDVWSANNPDKFESMSIKALPEDVQVRLRDVLTQIAAFWIVDQYAQDKEDLSPESVLSFGRENDGVTNCFTVAVRSTKGPYSVVTNIYSPWVRNAPRPTTNAEPLAPVQP